MDKLRGANSKLGPIWRTLGALALWTACGAPGPAPAPAAPSGLAGRPAAAPAAPAESPADRLYRLLIGTYDSADQAGRDSEFRTIHLEICPASAPELGRRVLYVEQAAAEARDKPYRQRLYVVEEVPGGAASRVFELRDPAAAVGACARPEPPSFAAAAAEERAGCAVTMTWRADHAGFVGGTHEHDCPSALRGAAYATSAVDLDAARLVSWDRGYDASGAQVWGAVKGPYEFMRRSPRP